VFIFFQTIPLNITTAQRSHDILLNETTDVTVAAEVEPYSQQMAHSEGISIQTSSANDSEDEQHSFVNQMLSYAVSSNDTTLNNSLKLRDTVPEVTSVSP
jgi:hypothetical protein